MLKRAALLLFIISAVVATVTHLLNAHLNQQNGGIVRAGVMVSTADDASYLVPAENFLLGRGWRTNDPGTAAWVFRSPGYGFVYTIFRFFLGVDAALRALFGLQVLLWSGAVAALPALLQSWSWPRKRSVYAACFVALMPMFWGFLSYTLTEALVPALLILALWAARVRVGGCQYGVLLSSAVTAALLLIRPALLFMLLPLLFSAWYCFPQKGLKSRLILVGFSVFIAVLPLGLWQLRNSAIAGHWPGLHATHHWDSNDLYRPVHAAIWDFHKLWNPNGMQFHTHMEALWERARTCKPADDVIDIIMERMPVGIAEWMDLSDLRMAYQAYFGILQEQAPYYESGISMPTEPMAHEIALVRDFEDFASSYKRGHWMRSMVVVPAQVYFRDMAAHSNLNLYMFQGPLRGHWAIEMLRILSFVVHLVVFLLFIPLVFYTLYRGGRHVGLVFGIGAYLMYIAMVQRGVEERYTLPVLVPMFVLVLDYCIVQTSFLKRRFLIKSNNSSTSRL